MGHIHVPHPTGRLEVVPICSRQIGRQLKLLRPLRHALPHNGLCRQSKNLVVGFFVRLLFPFDFLCALAQAEPA